MTQAGKLARQCFGAQGPWNALQQAMETRFPASSTDPILQPLLERSRAAMPRLARACIAAPVPALGGKPMTCVHDPARVSPAALAGLREAERPDTATQWIDRARGWLNAEAKAA